MIPATAEWVVPYSEWLSIVAGVFFMWGSTTMYYSFGMDPCK
jgi:hypothetical protein